MVMEPYDRKELTSFKTKIRSEKYQSMQVHGKRFCSMMIREMGWNSELSYRIPGKLYKRQNVVLYDLSGAIEIPYREYIFINKEEQ